MNQASRERPGRGRHLEFGPNSAWLAFPDASAERVADRLGLTLVRETAWDDAVGLVQRHPPARELPVYVISPIDGWTLALLAPGLADAFDLAALSREFGEVQRFATQRVVDSQRWERWVEGMPMRRYWWVGESGEVRLDDGEPAAAEPSLVHADDLERDWDELVFATEDTVLSVAEEWSVDPTSVETVGAARTGMLGYTRSSAS